MLNANTFKHPKTLFNITVACLQAARTGEIAIVTNRKGKVFMGVQRVKRKGAFPFKMLTRKGENVTSLVREVMKG